MDRLTAGCVGSGGARDAGGGYGAHMCTIYLHQKEGGFPGSQGEDQPQPGAPGKTMIVSQMDNRQREGRGVPDGVHAPQYRPACLGIPPLESPQGPPNHSKHIGGLQRKNSNNGASGQHQCDSGYNREMTVRGSGYRRVIFGQTSTLDDEVWGGKHGSQADCQGIRGMDGQLSPILGGLQGTDVGAPHWT